MFTCVTMWVKSKEIDSVGNFRLLFFKFVFKANLNNLNRDKENGLREVKEQDGKDGVKLKICN